MRAGVMEAPVEHENMITDSLRTEAPRSPLKAYGSFETTPFTTFKPCSKKCYDDLADQRAHKTFASELSSYRHNPRASGLQCAHVIW